MMHATPPTGSDQSFWDAAMARARQAAQAAVDGVDLVESTGQGEALVGFGRTRDCRPLPAATDYLHSDALVLYLADDDVDDSILLNRVAQVARAAVKGMDGERRRRFVDAGYPVILGGFDPDALRAAAAWWPVTLYDRERSAVVAVGLR